MHFETLEAVVVDKEDMAVEIEAGIEVDIVVEDIEACPCMLRGAEENFLKDFDKQSLGPDFLFVNSLRCCLSLKDPVGIYNLP